jgi:hypothetical protein
MVPKMKASVSHHFARQRACGNWGFSSPAAGVKVSSGSAGRIARSRRTAGKWRSSLRSVLFPISTADVFLYVSAVTAKGDK